MAMGLAIWNIQGHTNEQREMFKELQETDIDICILTATKKKGGGNKTMGIT